MIALVLTAALAAAPERTAPPPVAPPVPLAHAEPVVGGVDGVTVRSVHVPGARKVAIHLQLSRGYLDLDPSGESEAVTALDAAWGDASDTRDAEEVAAALDALGADFYDGVGAYVTSLQLVVPRADVDEAAGLFADLVWHADFPRDQHRLTRAEWARWYVDIAPGNPGAVADALLDHAWYPASHPNGRRPDPRAWRRLPVRDVEAAYAALLDDVPVDVLITGDLDRPAAEALARRVLDGHGRAGQRGKNPAQPRVDGTRVYAVDLPGREQANVRLRLPGPSRASPDVLAAEVASYALTGHFLARINRNLREDKGFTYGVWGGLSPGESGGSFDLGVDVKAGAVRDTLAEVERELGAMADKGATPDEIDLAWRAFVDNWNQWFGTAERAAGGYELAWWRRTDVAGLRADLDGYRAVTPTQTAAAAQRWWGATSPRVWVVVGDRDVIEPQLAGRTVVWVSAEDAVLGTGPLE